VDTNKRWDPLTIAQNAINLGGGARDGEGPGLTTKRSNKKRREITIMGLSSQKGVLKKKKLKSKRTSIGPKESGRRPE